MKKQVVFLLGCLLVQCNIFGAEKQKDTPSVLPAGIHDYAIKGDLANVKSCLESKVDINLQCKNNQQTALMYAASLAAQTGKPDLVKYLVSQNANKELPNISGETAQKSYAIHLLRKEKNRLKLGLFDEMSKKQYAEFTQQLMADPIYKLLDPNTPNAGAEKVSEATESKSSTSSSLKKGSS